MHFIIFVSSQLDNEALKTRGSPHVNLYIPPLPTSVPTESVLLSPTNMPSIEEVADITICDTYAVSQAVPYRKLGVCVCVCVCVHAYTK